MKGRNVVEGKYVASKLYGVNATIIIFVFVLYCIVRNVMKKLNVSLN